MESSTPTPDLKVGATNDSASPSLWFYMVGGLALLWNLLGLLAFIGQVTMTDESIEGLPEAQQELYRNIPTWAMIAFAVAVICGTLGSIGMVLRKSWCVPLFVISLLAVLVQNVYFFFLSDTLKVMGNQALIMPIMIILIGIFLVLLSSWAQSRNWLR